MLSAFSASTIGNVGMGICEQLFKTQASTGWKLGNEVATHPKFKQSSVKRSQYMEQCALKSAQNVE